MQLGMVELARLGVTTAEKLPNGHHAWKPPRAFMTIGPSRSSSVWPSPFVRHRSALSDSHRAPRGGRMP